MNWFIRNVKAFDEHNEEDNRKYAQNGDAGKYQNDNL